MSTENLGRCVTTQPNAFPKPEVYEIHSMRICHLKCTKDRKILTSSYDCASGIFDFDKKCFRFLVHQRSKIFCTDSIQKVILTGCEEPAIHFWNSESSQALSIIRKSSIDAYSVVFLNPKKILSPFQDPLKERTYTIQLWNRETNTCERIFHEHTDRITQIVLYTPNQFATASLDHFIHLWDVARDQPLQKWENREFPPCHVATLDKGEENMLISGSVSGMICIWDVRLENPLVKKISQHTLNVFSVAYLGGSRFASGSRDGTVKLHDLRMPDQPQTLGQNLFCVYSVSKTPDEGVACGTQDGKLYLWQL